MVNSFLLKFSILIIRFVSFSSLAYAPFTYFQRKYSVIRVLPNSEFMSTLVGGFRIF